MNLNITNSDIRLSRERFKVKSLRLYLLDEHLTAIDEIEGDCVSGDISIDAGSEIRRTLNVVLYAKDKTYTVSEYNRIWFNKRVKVQLCFLLPDRTQRWYDMGIFLFDNCSYTYSPDTKTISVQCSDLTAALDGTHGGVLDSSAFLIERGNDLKKVIEDLLNAHTSVKDYYVATIGEYGCLQGKSISWKQNRMDSGSTQSAVDIAERDGTDYLTDSPYLDDYGVLSWTTGDDVAAYESDIQIVSGVNPEDYIDLGSWHTIPYDLKFSDGTSVYQMMKKIRDLYPGYESYFDTDGQFIVDLIPTCEHEPLLLDYFDMEDLVIDETLNVDFSGIKNATHIYGKSIETDRYADQTAVSLKPYETAGENGYILEMDLDKFTLASNTKVGFQMPEINADTDTSLPLFLKVLLYESGISPTGEMIEKTSPAIIPCTFRETVVNTDAANLQSETVYTPMPLSCFTPGESYCFKYIKNQNTFMYLGMYQVEAYVEDNSPESPFAVDKIGLKLQILSGGEYDELPDTVSCRERAEYENWLAGRFNDTITLNTVMIPFLDVNQKVRYRCFSNGEIGQYIIKNIGYSLQENTCSITLNKFYDLYPFIVCS